MRWLARWARRMADIIDPDGAPHPIGLAYTLERGRGAVLHGEIFTRLTGDTPRGRPLYVLTEERDLAYIEADDPADEVLWKNAVAGRGPAVRRHSRPARSTREVIAPVAPGRQPYCVGCDREHAPPLHYHTL